MRSREYIEGFLRTFEDNLSSLGTSNDVSSRSVLFQAMRTDTALAAIFQKKFIVMRTERDQSIIIRSQLTRNLGTTCLRSEIVTPFNEVLNLKGSGEHGI